MEVTSPTLTHRVMSPICIPFVLEESGILMDMQHLVRIRSSLPHFLHTAKFCITSGKSCADSVAVGLDEPGHLLQ